MAGDNELFYALGTNLALQTAETNIKTLLSDKEMDLVVQGFSDSMKGGSKADKGGISEDTQRGILVQYGPQINEILNFRAAEMLEKNKEAGEAYIKQFLNNNPDARRTDSGLLYCETLEGEGLTPDSESAVQIHYHGTLIDDTVVDSSIERSQAAEATGNEKAKEAPAFPLSNVVKGLQEGLKLMKEGGKVSSTRGSVSALRQRLLMRPNSLRVLHLFLFIP